MRGPVGRLILLFSAAGQFLAGDANAADDKASPLTTAGPATPSVGGDVRGEPNLLDQEFLTARLTVLVPSKTLTTLTLAPLLTPSLYNPWWSETRVGIFAEDSGAFGFGAGWGYNQARARLSRSDPPLLEESESADDAKKRERQKAEVDRELAETFTSICAHVIQCAKEPNGDIACGGTKGAAEMCLKPLSPETLGTQSSELLGAISLPVLDPSQASAENIALSQLRSQLRKLRDERAALAVKLVRKADDGKIKKAQRKRLEDAYRNSIGLHLLGAVGFFPLVKAPDISPMTGAPPENPNAQHLRNLDAGAVFRFYFQRFILTQVRAGKRWDRTDALPSTGLAGEVYGSLDSAFFIPLVPEPDDTGFQKGIGFGLTVTQYDCQASGGCSTEVDVPQYPKALPLDWQFEAAGFAEVRLLKELQFRIGADFFVDKVHGMVTGTLPGTNSPKLYQLTPTLAVGSSFWGI